jgi:hypothetical protein
MILKTFQYRILFILLVMSFLIPEAMAQQTYTRILNWKYKEGTKVTPSKENNLLWFDGAITINDEVLPFYFERFAVETGVKETKVRIYNTVYQTLSIDEKAEYVENLKNQDEKGKIVSQILYDRKQTYTGVTINPFRLNSDNGEVEKLISFTIEIIPVFSGKGGSKAWSFASHSVLSSGAWYKLSVASSGIYILTYSDLTNMGISVDLIDPRNIRIFGQGGKMLPENNATFRFDDLQENAIYVAGEGDGKFDATDYILFYAVGPVSWTYDSINDYFQHNLNKYSTNAYYFINFNAPGKRITNESSLSQTPDYSVNTYQGYLFHEKDSLNLIKSGREFYGEVFDVQTSYNFVIQLPNVVSGSQMRLKASVLARSSATSYFKAYVNGSIVLNNLDVQQYDPNFESAYAKTNEKSGLTSATSSVDVKITYTKSTSSDIGWLNYFNLNYTSYLTFNSGQLAFRNGTSIKKGVTEFTLGNASGVTVWNVTDPLNVMAVTGTMSGNDLVFRLRTDSLLEFVAHNGSGYSTPQVIGVVANQDLHSLGQVDMVILTYPDFESQANRLADYHRTHDSLSVVVIEPALVYNEFSSGNQDPTAIRSFMKMFYDRAGSDPDLLPKYLLLFGDGSYDNMSRLADNTNYIITWQTVESLAPTDSYMSDDYFGYLDNTESGGYGGNIDVAIGRMPVKSVDEATATVDKILRYTSETELCGANALCNNFASSISNFGDWKNVICFVADDADEGEMFLSESDGIAKRIDTVYPVYNIDKIYCDAYHQESTPGGQRYPDVNDAINRRVEKGALLMNYIGHGGETGWAHEAILGVSDINAWDNTCNMPMFVTATCEFSRFDDPARTSAGEYVFLNPTGGGIALFTTTRLAYSGSNATLNSTFYSYILAKVSGKYPTMGEAVRNSKNNNGCSSQIANFCLLGDPALRLSYPEYQVVTTQLNNKPLGGINDTIRALSKVTIRGEVRDNSGNKLTSFNGLLYPSIFDKHMLITSLGNDGATPRSFYIQKNIIYKGKSSVTNGDFCFSFLVPKDIAYHFDKGKFSYYAHNGNIDANGYYNDFIVGGSENYAITDKEGPEVNLYLNDDKFVSGGITNDSPILFAKVTDSSGMNTVGSGIGHDISAVLDGNTDNTYVLNDYYEADLNTYTSGIVRYPFTDIETGTHTLELKVWDVFNNSSYRSIDFVVADNAELALDHVLNYPNPFTTYTEFWFEHNRPCCGLDVQVQIFTITGKLIKTIDTWVETTGYRADPIPWDGRDDYGDPIGKGVYIYKLRVKDIQGEYAEKIEKLVILK